MLGWCFCLTLSMNKNYRIKQVSQGGEIKFYPQEKVLGFLWVNIGHFGEYFSDIRYCESFLMSHIKSKQKSQVDYFYYDEDI